MGVSHGGSRPLAAVDANASVRFLGGSHLDRVSAMPFPSLFGSVPFFSERADAIELRQVRWRAVFAQRRICLPMLCFSEADQILQAVVVPITIDVMTVMPCWNGAVSCFPNGAVQALCTPSRAAFVVTLVRRVVGIRIPGVDFAVEGDALFSHR